MGSPSPQKITVDRKEVMGITQYERKPPQPRSGGNSDLSIGGDVIALRPCFTMRGPKVHYRNIVLIENEG
ncbi:hypothetical protein M407DRAFT_247143 [Tulasnella calospora MUT 4182]|uniref:Uncharacterized protein n=1 Tax=Tulasnella calospora MUT 4182 TaxID=1051891 RepID=A0A0C3Q0J0_9AGAM|nr:hypothetical protein M407DRAFT_247143 [Tulasnella calospora MUT 4182]